MAVTITVCDDELRSLERFYSSVKWEWWYSNHQDTIELYYTSKKMNGWEHLAWITWSTHNGSCPLFYPFAFSPFLLCFLFPPFIQFASLSHGNKKSFYMMYRGYKKKTRPLIIMSLSSRWLIKQMLGFKLRKIFYFTNAKKGNSILR